VTEAFSLQLCSDFSEVILMRSTALGGLLLATVIATALAGCSGSEDAAAAGAS